MRLATLILPNADNAGASLADVHAALQSDLCDNFGGFTSHAVNGAWRDSAGKVRYEPGTLYLVACDDSAKARETLESLARFHGHAALQECVFVVHANGEVVIVPCSYRVPHDSRDAIAAWQPA